MRLCVDRALHDSVNVLTSKDLTRIHVCVCECVRMKSHLDMFAFGARIKIKFGYMFALCDKYR